MLPLPPPESQPERRNNDTLALARLIEVVERLRVECPWDAAQTHQSLVPHLIEETGEVVEAIEVGTDDDLREELGDLLIQVLYHSDIARSSGSFTLADVAGEISDKLVRRHPHVFNGEDAPTDILVSWEQQKRAEKGRRSALDGIAEHLSSLTRATKVVSRARSHGVLTEALDGHVVARQATQYRVTLSTTPDPSDGEGHDGATPGEQILALVIAASEQGTDPEQSLRAALRSLEDRIADTEVHNSTNNDE